MLVFALGLSNTLFQKDGSKSGAARPAKTGILWQVPNGLKADLTLEHPRVLYTPDEIALARKNLAEGGPPWARSIAQKVIGQADHSALLELSDQAIRNLVPKPYAHYTYEIPTTCPDGSAMMPAGWQHPGKVRCGSGRLLPDADHPDDGSGWRDGEGHTYYFVARWNGYVIDVMTQALPKLAYAYTLTGQRKYAHTAAVILDAIATVYPTAIEGPLNYPGLAPGREGGRLERPYYQVARQLLNYVNAADLIWDSGELDDPSATNPGLSIKQNIAYNLMLNGADYCYRQVHKPAYAALQNGTADYNKGILAVGSLLGVERYVEWVIDGPTSIGNMIANNIDRDGEYYETSALYSDYTRGLYLDIAELLYHLRTSHYPQGINLYDNPQFERFYVDARAEQSILGRVPAYGDSGPDTKVGYSTAFDQSAFDQVLRFVVRANDAADRAQAGQRLAGLEGGEAPAAHLHDVWQLFNVDVLPSSIASADRAAAPLRSDLLAGKGIAYLRSGEGTFQRGAVMRYGATLNHGHPDELGLLIYAAGRELSFDPGYGSAHYRFGWTHQTVAHIDVVVDEHSQLSAASAGGSLNFFSAASGLSVVDASDESAYADADVSLYRRLLALVDTSAEASYLVDVFRVRGGRTRDYSFHAAGRQFGSEALQLSAPEPGSLAGPEYAWGNKVLPDGRIKGFETKAYSWHPAPDNGYGFLDGVQRAAGGSSWHAVWSDPAKVKLALLPQTRRQIIVADGPSPMGVKYILARETGEAPSTFVSVIDPVREGATFQTAAVDPLPVRADAGASGDEIAPVAFAVTLAPQDVSTSHAASATPAPPARDYFLSTLAARSFTAGSDAEALSTDAEFAMVRRRGGHTEAIHMIKGTGLSTGDLALSGVHRAYTGEIVSIDYAHKSLLVSSTFPLTDRLRGEQILINRAAYSHNSPYVIERVQPEGEGAYRIVLDTATLVLARGKLDIEPAGNRLPNVVRLPYSRNVTRKGADGYFAGKRVSNARGASTQITRVEDDNAGLQVNDTSEFHAGDDLTIYDVQAGDRFSIPLAVHLVQQEGNAFKLKAAEPVTIALPKATGGRMFIQDDTGTFVEIKPHALDGERAFRIDPGNNGEALIKIEGW